jgi:hypothetical protein
MASNVPAGTAPLMNSINGGTSNIRTNNVNTQAESDLDLEYAIALGIDSFPVKTNNRSPLFSTSAEGHLVSSW